MENIADVTINSEHNFLILFVYKWSLVVEYIPDVIFEAWYFINDCLGSAADFNLFFFTLKSRKI